MGRTYEDTNFRVEVVRSSAEALELAATYGPFSSLPPRHFHPHQQETFVVRQGAMRFFVNDVEQVVRAGESIVIEPRAVHQVCNAGGEEAVVSWITRPAQRSEEMLAALDAWKKRGRPVLGAAVLAREFRAEFRLTKPGPVVQACVFGLLAQVGRMLGHGVRK